jgi:hypothetical protein
MEDGIGDGCGDAGRAQLADAFTANRAGLLVDLIDKVDRYVGGNVGIHRDRNAGQVLGDRMQSLGRRVCLP